MMKVLVCGGRKYSNKAYLTKKLDALHTATPITELICGMAQGADMLAYLWAEEHEVNRHGFPADWSRHGKAAGPIRNALMLEEGKPDLVLAFPGGRGTKDMIAKAQLAGVKVVEL